MLQGDVPLHILQFFSERDQSSNPLQTVAEQRREGFDYLSDVSLPIHKTIPADRFQRIKEKMRVDLTLQSAQLGLGNGILCQQFLVL